MAFALRHRWIDVRMMEYSRTSSRDVGTDSNLRLGSLALLALASIAFLGASTINVHGQTCAAQYQGGTNGSVYAGGTFSVYNTFTNTGSVVIQITSIQLALDFGTYSASSGLPLSVPVGTSQTVYFDMQVPSDASLGDHTANTTIGFQCYVNGSWITPSFESTWSTVTIGQNPGASAEIVRIIYGVVIGGALVVAGIVVFVFLRRRQTPPPPEPSYMPSLPPSETLSGSGASLTSEDPVILFPVLIRAQPPSQTIVVFDCERLASEITQSLVDILCVSGKNIRPIVKC